MTPSQTKLMEQCRRDAPYSVLRLNDRHTPTYVIHGGPVHISAFWVTERDAKSECDLLNAIHAQALYDERSKAKAPQYTRQGPPIQMQDVLLAFGELNERECMIVQWVLSKVNALPESNGLTVAEVMDVVGPLCLGDATSSAIRSKLTALRQSKSK